jgi:hypothetical protein
MLETMGRRSPSFVVGDRDFESSRSCRVGLRATAVTSRSTVGRSKLGRSPPARVLSTRRVAPDEAFGTHKP